MSDGKPLGSDIGLCKAQDVQSRFDLPVEKKVKAQSSVMKNSIHPRVPWFLNLFADQRTPEGLLIVDFGPGLLLMLPAASLVGLLYLMWRLDGVESTQ